MSTFLRSRKSLTGSLPAITGVEPRPLDTDAALDVEGREGPASGLGVGALEAGAVTAAEEVAEIEGF
jgi:hypothetical protein